MAKKKNSFPLCSNSCCSRAGWCKRFTYIITSHGELNEEDFNREFFEPDKNYSCYVKNANRRCYERDNTDDRYDEPNQAEYEYNYWKSRLRQDDNPDREAQDPVPEGTGSEQGSVLQLQCSGDRRSDTQGSNLPWRPINVVDWPTTLEGVEQRIDAIIEQIRSLTVLSDSTLDGVSPSGPDTRLSDDRVPAEELRESDTDADSRSAED